MIAVGVSTLHSVVLVGSGMAGVVCEVSRPGYFYMQLGFVPGDPDNSQVPDPESQHTGGFRAVAVDGLTSGQAVKETWLEVGG